MSSESLTVVTLRADISVSVQSEACSLLDKNPRKQSSVEEGESSFGPSSNVTCGHKRSWNVGGALGEERRGDCCAFVFGCNSENENEAEKKLLNPPFYSILELIWLQKSKSLLSVKLCTLMLRFRVDPFSCWSRRSWDDSADHFKSIVCVCLLSRLLLREQHC